MSLRTTQWLLPLALVLLAGCGDKEHAQDGKATDSHIAAAVPAVTSLSETLDNRPGLPNASSRGRPLGEYKLPPAEFETKYLSLSLCDDCDQEALALREVNKLYPDVFKVKFRPSAEIAEDAETLKMYKTSFYMGLYYAKLIRMADGQSLFDFLTHCSRSVKSQGGADLGLQLDGKMYVGLFYYPTLIDLDTGNDIEMRLLFDRQGDTFMAKSIAFSTAALTDPDFMVHSRLACAKPSRPNQDSTARTGRGEKGMD